MGGGGGGVCVCSSLSGIEAMWVNLHSNPSSSWLQENLDQSHNFREAKITSIKNNDLEMSTWIIN